MHPNMMSAPHVAVMVSRRSLLLSLALRLLVFSFASAVNPRPLEGVRLRCCTLTEGPIIFQNENRKEHLGFRCESLKLYNETDDGIGFTRFIHEMQKCTTDEGTIRQSPKCSCDIGVGGWMLNQERRGRVDFLPPFVIESFEVLVHIDNTSRSTTGAFFLTAFSGIVWACIATLFVIFTFLKLLDRRFARPDPSFTPLPASESRHRRLKHFLLKSKIPLRLRRAVQDTLMRMIGQAGSHSVQDSPSSRHWVLNFAIALSSLFLILAYESSMTAFLVQETIQSNYQTVQDLKSCRVRASDVCIPKGGALDAFWNNSITSKPCHKKSGADMPIYYHTHDEGLQKLTTKECKYLIASGAVVRDAATDGKYCQKLLVCGEPFYRAGISFVLPRGSNRTADISQATLQLREAGIIPSVNEYVSRRGNCNIQPTSSLTFPKLRLFFILAYIACFVIFLEMIIDPQTALKTESQENEMEKDVKENV